MVMKKTDPRWTDARVIASSGNVFVDLGFNQAEAEVLARRAKATIKKSASEIAKSKVESAKKKAATKVMAATRDMEAAHAQPRTGRKNVSARINRAGRRYAKASRDSLETNMSIAPAPQSRPRRRGL